MPNEFSLKAEQESVQGKYTVVECACGWRGPQSALEPSTTKDRKCPKCGLAFKRETRR